MRSKPHRRTRPPTLSFIASPEIVTAMAFAGRLSFNPLIDQLESESGARFKFDAPTAEELPDDGFAAGLAGYQAPSSDPDSIHVVIAPDSKRIQELSPFEKWDGRELTDRNSPPFRRPRPAVCWSQRTAPRRRSNNH